MATFLRSLCLARFRNHFETRIVSDEAPVCIVAGPNGAGKTSILEAIHLMATGVGIRTRRDRDFVRFGAEGYRVDCLTDARISLGLKYLSGGTRAAFQDGVALARWTDLIGRIRVALLRPEDIRLVEEGPEYRRRYLDIMLSQADRSYFDTLRRFRRALKQRAAIVGARAALRRSFSAAMIDEMGCLFEARAAAVSQLAGLISGIADEFDPGSSIAVSYRPAVPARSTSGSWREQAEACAREGERIEDAGAISPFGPHRDDMEILWNGKSLRQFGSQGQKRLVALALRLAEADFLTRDGSPPLLLVDDIFGELDPVRSERFLDYIAASRSQVWLATTQPEPFENRWKNWLEFRIRAGVVETSKESCRS